MEHIPNLGLLTAEEVIQALRLDDHKDPKSALAYLRRTRRLRPVRIGKTFRYLTDDVRKLVMDSISN